jgi:hypothetical protein
MKTDVTAQEENVDTLDLEEVERILKEDLLKHHKDENYFISWANKKNAIVVYPNMDYLKLAKNKDKILENFNNDSGLAKKKIYIISGNDIKKGKNRWFKA